MLIFGCLSYKAYNCIQLLTYSLDVKFVCLLLNLYISQNSEGGTAEQMTGHTATRLFIVEQFITDHTAAVEVSTVAVHTQLLTPTIVYRTTATRYNTDTQSKLSISLMYKWQTTIAGHEMYTKPMPFHISKYVTVPNGKENISFSNNNVKLVYDLWKCSAAEESTRNAHTT